jgi:2-polyprenyl-6-methoxyphenol hydroxylase-like FAD-dependent oxidoreductase
MPGNVGLAGGSRVTAVVVGAGIAGCACALFLKRSGHEVLLLEARSGPAVENGAGLLIAPQGMRVLGHLDLASAIEQRGVLMRRMQLEDEYGTVLMRMAIGRRRLPPAVMVARSALLQGLLREAGAAGVALRYGARLTAIQQTASGARVVLADGSTLRADLIVGADGLHSSVRSVIFPNVPAPRPTGFSTIGGIAEHLPGRADPHALHLSVSPRGYFAYAALALAPRGRATWWCTLPVPQGALPGEEPWQLRAWLRAHGALPGPLGQLLEHSTHLSGTTLFDLDPPLLWSAQRTVLIGDAAHATPAHSGHGASLALEDAEFLAASLAQRGTLATALAHFQTRRWRRIARLREQTRAHGRNTRTVPRQQRIPRLLMQVTAPRPAPAQNRSFWYGGVQED